MKSFIAIISCLLAAFNFFLMSNTLVITSLEADAQPPYPIVEGIFSGDVNGVQYQINGTISSVLAELMAKHPDVDFEARGEANKNSTSVATLGLEKRNNIWNPLCFSRGYRWETTTKYWFDTVVVWGRQAGGRITVAPKACAFLNCRLDARVYICNDGGDTIEPAVAYLVSYVEDICNYKPCQYRSFNFGMQCGGQMFDTDDYNVIARRRFKSEDKCWGDIGGKRL